MGNAQPHPPTGSARLTVSPATQCDMGLCLTSRKEITDRSDPERLRQPLCAWDFLQLAGQGCPVMTSLAFLMPGKSPLWKHGICGKTAWSGIHPAGQGLTRSSCERRVNLYHEWGTAKVHGNMELRTLTRPHLTIMGFPSSDRALGFIIPCYLTCDRINK